MSASEASKKNLEELTPREIVSQLDNYIIGQEKAKKAVAIVKPSFPFGIGGKINKRIGGKCLVV